MGESHKTLTLDCTLKAPWSSRDRPINVLRLHHSGKPFILNNPLKHNDLPQNPIFIITQLQMILNQARLQEIVVTDPHKQSCFMAMRIFCLILEATCANKSQNKKGSLCQES